MYGCNQCARSHTACTYNRLQNKKRLPRTSKAKRPSLLTNSEFIKSASIPKELYINHNSPASHIPHFPSKYHENLISLFFRFVYPIFPMLHRKSISLAETHPILLNAMFACAASYSTDTELKENDAFPGDSFYFQARSYVDECLDVFDVSTVQALLLMSFFASNSARRK